MQIRIPFLGIPSPAPLQGLLEHYEPVAKGLSVIERALKGYLHGGTSKGFMALAAEMDSLEGEADKIKRKVRNHLPRGLFMAVDKTLFLNYSRGQDDIMDQAQEALHWLALRHVELPEKVREDLRAFLPEVTRSVAMLLPALKGTVALVLGRGPNGGADRKQLKDDIHNVREQHMRVVKARFRLVSDVYSSELDFKDIYQIIHFVDCLQGMSHSAEGCADVLRAMIAR
ncbi:putative phosphate transport regulator [Desulfovibrio sp. X2]|uniref:DUF47 domain-containing protein n=1 Tax=Desulfovibrio sp. X2 TaxID=941449 RepID=UPI000358AEBB|nr:DUF47 family protein [Desulfovibrio sp. X2]EPR43787.1 putative phosphate transport regulator [Desulfovibrio sp. X2]